jgi:creatinine amidohydrolase
MSEDRLGHAGYSVFHETMADMTFPEIERAARAGAVTLWGLGVIEEHGPHLPLATDVYVPTAILRLARRLLAREGIESVIVPPLYWGINHATGRFAGSFLLRPEVMIELMGDVFGSLKKDGFSRVFCLSGHGDAAHNKTILEGVRKGSRTAGIDVRVIAKPAALQRLGFDAADPHLAVTEASPPKPAKYVDVHAGDWETSLVWAVYPEVVRSALLPDLVPTNYGPADLDEWRKGGEHAVRKTPHGYLGDPAAADRARGLALLEEEARLVAGAIAAAVKRSTTA